MLIPGIPYILYVKGANPALGITVFIIEILLVGLILGYNWFNKRRIKKWDKISGKKNKKNSNQAFSRETRPYSQDMNLGSPAVIKAQ